MQKINRGIFGRGGTLLTSPAVRSVSSFSGMIVPKIDGTSRSYMNQYSVAICQFFENLWYQVASYCCRLLYAYLPSLIPLAQA